MIPTDETVSLIKAREEYLTAMEARDKELSDARKLAQDRLLQIQDDQQPLPTNDTPPPPLSTETTHKLIIGATSAMVDNKFKVMENNTGEYCSANKADRDYTRFLDIIFTAERNWCSQCMQLLPGDYYVIADIDYEVPYLEARKRCIPRDISDAPWIESKLVRLIMEERGHQSTEKPFRPPSQEDSASIYTETSVQKLEKKLFPENYKQIKDNESVESLTKMKQRQDGETADTMDHRIWVEASTTDDVELTVIKFHEDLIRADASNGVGTILRNLNEGNDDMGVSSKQSQGLNNDEGVDSVTLATATNPGEIDTLTYGRFRHSSQHHHVTLPSPLLPNLVQHEKWPFLAESQGEVSSRELVNRISLLREEAEILGAEFISLAAKYREERKRLLLSSKNS